MPNGKLFSSLAHTQTTVFRVAGNIKLLNIIFIGIAALALAVGAYFLISAKPDDSVVTAKTPVPSVVATPAVLATPTPEPTPTVAPTPPPEPTPTPEPLPELNGSDNEITAALANQNPALIPLITTEELIRKFVRAAYSAHQGNVVQQYRPVNGPNTPFLASATGDMVKIKTSKGALDTAAWVPNGKTFGRYSVYVNTLNTLPAKSLKDVYVHYYPLLQRAYSELGEGPKQFHTVMLKALDLMINTPDITDEYVLVQTSVMYTFKDPQLEALPPMQKLLLRMGKFNREKLVNNLKDFRDEIGSFTP